MSDDLRVEEYSNEGEVSMRMNGYLKLSSGLPRYAIAAFEAVYINFITLP